MLENEFALQPSRYYLFFLGITLLASALIVVSLPLNILLRLGGLVLVMIYGAWILWQQGWLRGRSSIIGIRWIEKRMWMVKTNSGEYMAELRGDSTVTGLVSVLRFKVEGRVLGCVICGDAVVGEGYRRLLVHLKMY